MVQTRHFPTSTPAMASSADSTNSASPIHSSTKNQPLKTSSIIDMMIEGDEGDDGLPFPHIGTSTRKCRSNRKATAPPAKKSRPMGDSGLRERQLAFQSRPIISGLVIDFSWLECENIADLGNLIKEQGWELLFSELYKNPIPFSELVQFYTHLSLSEGGITTTVNGNYIDLTEEVLSEILGISKEGYSGHAKKSQNIPDLSQAKLAGLVQKFTKIKSHPVKAFSQDFLSPLQKILYNVVRRCIVPRSEGRTSVELLDAVYIDHLETGSKINFPGLMLKHMIYVSHQSSHGLPYGPLINLILKHFDIIIDPRKEIPHNVRNVINKDFIGSIGIVVKNGRFVFMKSPLSEEDEELFCKIEEVISSKFLRLETHIGRKFNEMGSRLDRLEHALQPSAMPLVSSQPAELVRVTSVPVAADIPPAVAVASESLSQPSSSGF